MIAIRRITQSSYNKLKQLVYTVISARGTFTAEEYGPYGMDSRAPEDNAVLYDNTERDGDEVIIGVLNKDRKAEIGEVRLFCTDENGAFKFNVWLRADGTLFIGDSDQPSSFTNFAVKYNEALAEINKLKTTVDDVVQKWNAFATAYVPGGPTVVGSPPTLSTSMVTANNSDFTKMKNEKIKTN